MGAVAVSQAGFGGQQGGSSVWKSGWGEGNGTGPAGNKLVISVWV